MDSIRDDSKEGLNVNEINETDQKMINELADKNETELQKDEEKKKDEDTGGNDKISLKNSSNRLDRT